MWSTVTSNIPRENNFKFDLYIEKQKDKFRYEYIYFLYLNVIN